MNYLKNLSDKALVQQLHRYVRKEKQNTLEVLSHLAEVARRELYLAKGYGSLFDYCVSELGYGESSAWRRVRVARAIKDIPLVYDLMESGQLTFSAVCQVTKALTPKNHMQLLPRLVGGSKAEIERVVAEYQPPVPILDQAKPRIMKKVVPVESPPSGAPSNAARGRPPLELGGISRHSDGKFHPTVEASAPKKVVYEKMYEVRFAGDEELMELMNWLRSHLSHRFPKGASYQEMFKYAMRYVREREDLTKRVERRKKRQMQKKQPSRSAKTKGGTPSRHIAIIEKEKVWVRDRGKCSYIAPGGRRCHSSHNLQYDHHPIPFARGGPSTADNLRLLCGKHNQLTAIHVFGEQHMERYRKRE